MDITRKSILEKAFNLINVNVSLILLQILSQIDFQNKYDFQSKGSIHPLILWSMNLMHEVPNI